MKNITNIQGYANNIALRFKLCLELQESNGFNTDNLHFILLTPEVTTDTESTLALIYTLYENNMY
jgi:hypothetical protein